jgi:hypothetical protein
MSYKVHRANELLKRCTYKPGVEIRIVELESYGLPPTAKLVMTYMAEDTRGIKTGENELVFQQLIPWPIFDQLDNEAYFFQYIAQCIEEMEIHEAREWFKVDGLMLTDPHHEVETWKPNAQKV